MVLKQKDIVIWLSHIEGVGSGDIKHLINYFHNIEEIWYVGRKHIVSALGGREELASKITENRDEQFLVKISRSLKDNNILPLTIYDSAYPSKLKNIYDPPYTI
ncbi:MAG TPA: DNA-protecting protein DprA, partial [Clostridia bacterium]|nr:DNA-protecting protein DprA [Clostridia bacterium]